MNKFPIISGASTKTFWRSFALTVLRSRQFQIVLNWPLFRRLRNEPILQIMRKRFRLSDIDVSIDVTRDQYGRVFSMCPRPTMFQSESTEKTNTGMTIFSKEMMGL